MREWIWEVGIAQVGPGTATAAFEIDRAIDYFLPTVALFVGVAGGIKDVRIGDVVVATKVYGYELGKAVGQRFLPRPDIGESSHRLVQRAQAEARKNDWMQRIRGNAGSTPQVFVGAIASGEKVVASTRSEIYRFLQSMYSDALAVEMEARGFLKATHANEYVQALIIRGISDLLIGKSKADASGTQDLAARHASAFAYEILSRLDPTTGAPTQMQSVPQTLTHQTGSTVGHGISPIKKGVQDDWLPPKDIAVLPLPPRASGLVGRVIEQEWLKARLLEGKTTGVWAFAGMGGVGKTSLVADLLPKMIEEFPGGIGVIRANEIVDPHIIIRQLVEKFVPDGPELLERGALTKAALSSRLAATMTDLRAGGKRALVAIDNVESELIPRLKPLLDLLHATQVSVVITAREELDKRLVDDSLEVNVLSDEMATELFRRLVYGSEGEKFSSEDILAICRITGNHTQALVLAAADLNQRALTSISDYRHHLESAPDAVLNLYDQLSTETPDGVRLTFASSYEHLKEPVQKLFVALGTLAGPSCTVPAAIALSATPGNTPNPYASLEVLLNAKLIRKSATTKPQGVQRIELHPLVQQFARELLAILPTSEADNIHGALAQHYGQWVEGKSEDLLRADDLNLVSALEWARDHRPRSDLILAQLTFHLREYWQRRLQLDQATTWLPLGIDAMNYLDEHWRNLQGELAHSLASMYYGGGRTEEARKYYIQSLELFRKVNDKKGEGLALHSLGILEMHTGDVAAAKSYLTQSLHKRREIGDRQGEGQALNSLGLLALDVDPPAAREYLTQSLEIRRELGERRNEALTLRSLGSLARNMGDREAARQYYTDSLNIFRKISFRRDEAITLQYLGVLFRETDPASAREYYNDSLDILSEIDDLKNKIASLYGLGFVHLELDDLETARHYFDESLWLCKQVKDQRSEGITLRGLGILAERYGEFDRAERYFRDALALAEKVQFIENIAKLYELLGRLLLNNRNGDGTIEGCQMLSQAIKTYKQIGRPDEAERVEQERIQLDCSHESEG
jgi:nucleoside phosphorylase/tetratricopeptide (TPR) repeat protein